MPPKRDPWPDTDKLVAWATPVVLEGFRGGPEFLGVHLYVVDPEDRYVDRGTSYWRGWWLLVAEPYDQDMAKYAPVGSHQVTMLRYRFRSPVAPASASLAHVYGAASPLPMSKGGGQCDFLYLPWSGELVTRGKNTLRQVDMDLLTELFLAAGFRALRDAEAQIRQSGAGAVTEPPLSVRLHEGR